MSSNNIEVGVVREDKKFQVLSPQQIKEYLDELNWFVWIDDKYQIVQYLEIITLLNLPQADSLRWYSRRFGLLSPPSHKGSAELEQSGRLQSILVKIYLANKEYFMMTVSFFILFFPFCDYFAQVVKKDQVETKRNDRNHEIMPPFCWIDKYNYH